MSVSNPGCRGTPNHSVHHFYLEVWFAFSMKFTQAWQGITNLITQQNFLFHLQASQGSILPQDHSGCLHRYTFVDGKDSGLCIWSRGRKNRRMVCCFSRGAWRGSFKLLYYSCYVNIFNFKMLWFSSTPEKSYL